MALPAEIAALIETFAANEADYTAAEFKEAQVRQQFIDPLFAALGWDVANTAGYAEAYKEVIHEDAIKIGGETKAPDYSFRIGGNRKFFVEAKKPAVLIKDHPEPAYQLRRYSWSAKLPLGILTDFQEFAVYDTRVKPSPTDKASAARLFYCRYDELEKHWDFIAGTFSKDAVLKGSFDKYAATAKGKRGTTTVDDAFLEEIEKWRDLLARNLALRNPALDTRGLNFAVQRIIDRIVFLRIAEDRGNEPFGQLQALTAAVASDTDSVLEEPGAYGGHKPKRPPTIYPRLVQIFEKADYRYNSGLFHFAKDSDCAETPDTLTPGLVIDDAVLKQILGSLYYPQSPYVFTVLPAYILGHVYEQFLGKVIRLTDGHQAKVEEKPEVRKAGGVYYTPQYIVDYIVQKTVGPLLTGKTPKQIETLAIIDIACGSGTFLLGAYDYLLKWYLDHYSANAPEKWAKQGRIYETAPNAAYKVAHTSSLLPPPGTPPSPPAHIPDPNRGKGSPPAPPLPARSWQLTTAERRRILLAHINGVDIDAAAVEVTKLSLLLKVLEGERREFQGRTREMAAVLPDLSKNIKCGNSLIGHDFYSQPDLPTLDAEAKYKLNTFEWKDGFPEVMKRGGFDAVIGNPPWIDIKGLDAHSVTYFFCKYTSSENRINIYAAFMEKALTLMQPAHGRIGFITPSSYLTQSSYAKLRQLIFQHQIEAIVRTPDTVFKNVIAESAIIIASSEKKQDPTEIAVYERAAIITEIDITRAKINKAISQNDWIQAGQTINLNHDPKGNLLITKISAQTALEEVCEISLGLTPYDKYKGHTQDQISGRVFHSNKQKGKTWKPLLAGGNINRYNVSDQCNEYINYGDWLGAPRQQRFFTEERILIRQIISGKPPRIYAGYTNQELYNTQIAFNLLRREHINESIFYILGILNSRLVTWYHRFKCLDATKDTFQKILIQDARQLPIRRVNYSNKADTSLHNNVDKNVSQMLALHRAQAAAQSPHEKDALAKQITATDRQIDALVYQLYALTPDEIALIEGTA